LITARDMAIATPMQAPEAPNVAAAPLTERILLVVLFVAALTSPVAFIEPSPHDALMGVLAIACLIAGVRFERTVVLPLLLLMVWNFSGMMSLLNVAGEEKTIQYTGTSLYLAIAALIFACLFAHNTMPRLATMRAAYILAAVLVSVAGISGYLSLFPGSAVFLSMDRAAGTFKDPNVFGPFLIWPILFVTQRMILRSVNLRDLVILGILSTGLFLCFSRGAWAHMAVSGVMLLALMFISAPDTRFRMRLVTLSVIVVTVIALLIFALLSLDSVRDMFEQRAHVVQSYDVGEGGRFRLQELSFGSLLDYPNGMGPYEFGRVHGVQQHNTYLQAFMVYGWAGGMAYLLLLLATLRVALRTVFVDTPWQPYLIVAVAAFVGEMFEGFVIDTDHWRHFYLMLGMIWGLAAATNKITRHARTQTSFRQVSDVGAA